jgi:hypothetical protein
MSATTKRQTSVSMATLPIVHSILAGHPTVPEVLAHHKRLSWVVRHHRDVDSCVLQVMLDYVRSQKKLPANLNDLDSFIEATETTETIPTDIRNRYVLGEAKTYLDAINHLEDMDGRTATDFNLLANDAVDQARLDLYEMAWQLGIHTLSGSKNGAETLKGIEDAKAEVRKMLSSDPGGSNRAPLDGDWVKNLDHVEDELLKVIDDGEKNRILTGFRHIDDVVTIGPGHTSYIGILGRTNHGKTAYLLTMVYNMVCAGRRVLLVPLEATVTETWTRLAFMHASQFSDIDMPSYSDWLAHPERVTPAQVSDMQIIMQDLRSGVGVAGSLDVVSASDWASIMDRLEASKEPYDVLAVDYIAHLNTTGRDQKEELSGIFRKAQSLTFSYNCGRGIVVITPLQANKEGAVEADKAEGDDWGCYTDPKAIDWFTSASHDMGLIIGVWQKAWLKDSNQIKVSCTKAKGPYFEPHYVRCDPKTRYLHDDGEGMNAMNSVIRWPPGKMQADAVYVKDLWVPDEDDE